MTNLNKLKDVINMIKSPKLYIIVGVALLVIIGIIILLNHKKGNWLLWIGIPTTICALIFIVSKFIVPNIAISLLKKANTESLHVIITPFVNSLFENLFKYGLILLGIGIILIIGYIIVRKHSKA